MNVDKRPKLTPHQGGYTDSHNTCGKVTPLISQCREVNETVAIWSTHFDSKEQIQVTDSTECFEGDGATGTLRH